MSARAELIREAAERAASEGPRSLIEHYDEVFTEDFRWKPALIGTLEGVEYHGREGFARYWEDFEATFRSFKYTDATFHEVGENTVMVKLRLCLEGTESGVPIEQDVGWILHFEGDRVAAGETHMTWADTEAAAHAQA